MIASLPSNQQTMAEKGSTNYGKKFPTVSRENKGGETFSLKKRRCVAVIQKSYCMEMISHMES